MNVADHPCAAAVLRVLRRFIPCRIPDRLGRLMNLFEVAHEITSVSQRIFLRDERAAPGVRRHGEVPDRPALARSMLFYEYFHGETARGSARATRPDGPDSSPRSGRPSGLWMPTRCSSSGQGRHPGTARSSSRDRRRRDQCRRESKRRDARGAGRRRTRWRATRRRSSRAEARAAGEVPAAGSPSRSAAAGLRGRCCARWAPWTCRGRSVHVVQVDERIAASG